jgi:hypothetical protein
VSLIHGLPGGDAHTLPLLACKVTSLSTSPDASWTRKKPKSEPRGGCRGVHSRTCIDESAIGASFRRRGLADRVRKAM